MFGRVALALLAVAFCGVASRCQSDTPIISGGVGFLGSTNAGATSFQPVLAPVLTVPLGDKFLVESRADIRGFISREDGTSGPYQGQSFETLEYLQLDYLANSHLTITAGRFLTPFGIFNERLNPIWINKFQDAPLIAAIGIGIGYSDGFMLRGNLVENRNYAINYSTYFSTLSTVNKFESVRGTGGRLGVFFPRARLEVGTSYQRRLQNLRANSFGTDVSWLPFSAPLEVKGEFAHSPSGEGYWIQAAYRLSAIPRAPAFAARLEPVFRMQQFFRLTLLAGDELPQQNARRPDFGLNCYLPHEIRLNASYGREYFAHATDVNVWNFGITYRFMFPLLPGESK
jgi:hypothetical protein